MTEHIPRPALLYPDPQKHADLMSWHAANRFLQQEQDRGGAGFVDTFRAAAQDHPAPLVRAHIDEIVKSGEDVERALALLGAAAGGHIVVYAKPIGDQECPMSSHLRCGRRHGRASSIQ